MVELVRLAQLSWESCCVRICLRLARREMMTQCKRTPAVGVPLTRLNHRSLVEPSKYLKKFTRNDVSPMFI